MAIEINVLGNSVLETGDPFLNFVIFLSEPASETVSVSYRMLQGSAGGDDLQDYTPLTQGNGDLTFAAGEVSKTISIRPRTDFVDKMDDGLVLELYNPSANAAFAGGVPLLRAPGVILDHDGAANDPALFVSNPVLVEGDSGFKSAPFAVTLSRPTSMETTLDYATSDIGAAPGTDYEGQTGALTYAPDEQAKIVPVNGNTALEAVETFGLTVNPLAALDSNAATETAQIIGTDEMLPQISIASASVEEGAGRMMRFVVTLSEPVEDIVTFSYRTLPGTANARDLTAPLTSPINSGLLAIAPGQTSLSFFVEVAADTQDENDEFITVELFNPSANAMFSGAAPVLRGTGVILDDDGSDDNLALLVSSPVIVEGDDGTSFAVFDIMLSRPAQAQMVMGFATSDIEAQAGEDYAATSGILQFAPGQQYQSVSVPIIGDVLPEASERFALIVTPSDGTQIDTRGATGEALILDTDQSPLPEISISGGSAIEGDGSYIQFIVTLSEPSASTVTVAFRTVPGTGLGTDLNTRPTSQENNGSVVFAPGQTSASIRIETNTDGLDERDESIFIEVSDPSPNAVLSGGGDLLRAMGIIQDDDGTGSNTAIFVSNPTVVESDAGDITALFEISLSRPADAPITIDYRTADITATSGIDYAHSSGVLSFAQGQQTRTVAVPILGDSDGEIAERFALIVTPAQGTDSDLLGTTGEATILDTDIGDLPQISVHAIDAVEGHVGFVRYVVTLSEASETAVLVDWDALTGTAHGNDLGFLPTSGTLSFHPGQTHHQIFVHTRSDTENEFDETVFLQLTNPVGAVFGDLGPMLTETGFILDDDGTGSSNVIGGGLVQLSETGAPFTDYRVLIDISRPTDAPQRFDLSLEGDAVTLGDDLILIDPYVDFAAGQTSSSATIRVFSDTLAESTETAQLILTAQDGTLFDGTIIPIGIEILDGLPPQIPTEGNDTLIGTLSADDVYLGAGDDIFSGLSGNDVFHPGPGDDVLDGGHGWDTVSYATAPGGVEVYMKHAGLDVGSGQGRDTFISVEHVVGSDFADRLGGDTNNNTLTGGRGDDVLRGNGGNDVFYGGDGDDRIRADAGDDILFGNAGTDNITAQGGNDILYGGADRDFLYGGRGDDAVYGGDGDDAVRGNLGADLVDGEAGDDDVRGGGGDDDLLGGAGDDFLLGENGRDTLFGGSGNDILTGGTGSSAGDDSPDTFVFADSANGGGGYDQIRDFEDGIDVLDLTAFGFTDFATQVLPLAQERPSGLRIGFGNDDTLFLHDMTLAMFSADDVILV